MTDDPPTGATVRTGGPRIGREPGGRVPVSVVTGFLGAGKTTAILGAMARRSGGERWAVVVNELGEVGIDGPRLQAGGVEVREVAGGCVCCTAGLEMKVALVRILREIQPDRLIVEPSGAARPSAVLDALRGPGMRDAVAPRAVIGLVDPRRLADPRLRGLALFDEQLAAADVLVASHADEASPEDLDRFWALASALSPRKLVVDTMDRDGLQPGWLDLDPSPPGPRYLQVEHATFPGSGRVWPADAVFDARRIEEALQAVVRPGVLPAGVARIKGMLRTTRGWRAVDGTDVELRWTPSSWRRDSRLEILAFEAPGSWGDVWAAIEAALQEGG